MKKAHVNHGLFFVRLMRLSIQLSNRFLLADSFGPEEVLNE
jgi:hypothetical protein